MKAGHALAALVLALISLNASAAMYVNSGSDSDYVYCKGTNPDGSNKFGNCPTKGRQLEIESVRDGVIRFRFYDMGGVFPWFYAKVIDSDNGVYRELTSLPDSVDEAQDLQLTGDYVIINQYSKKNPADKEVFTRETFFKISQ